MAAQEKRTNTNGYTPRRITAHSNRSTVSYGTRTDTTGVRARGSVTIERADAEDGRRGARPDGCERHPRGRCGGQMAHDSLVSVPHRHQRGENARIAHEVAPGAHDRRVRARSGPSGDGEAA